MWTRTDFLLWTTNIVFQFSPAGPTHIQKLMTSFPPTLHRDFLLYLPENNFMWNHQKGPHYHPMYFADSLGYKATPSNVGCWQPTARSDTQHQYLSWPPPRWPAEVSDFNTAFGYKLVSTDSKGYQVLNSTSFHTHYVVLPSPLFQFSWNSSFLSIFFN